MIPSSSANVTRMLCTDAVDLFMEDLFVSLSFISEQRRTSNAVEMSALKNQRSFGSC